MKLNSHFVFRKANHLKVKIKKEYLLSLILFFLCLVNITLILYFLGRFTQIPTTPELQLNTKRAEMMQLINLSGFHKVYENIKTEYASDNINGHLQAHLFGELLFQYEGYDGINICDSALGYGCAHGLIISAISHQGIESIYKLDQACIKSFGPTPLSCQHGIGHGILEYLGHEKLLEALNYCDKLSWKGTLLGCKGGAVMDYISPTPLSDGIIKIYSDVTINKPFGPCPSFPNKYHLVCIYEIRRSWEGIYNNDFKKIGKVCTMLNSPIENKICNLGIGDSVSSYTKFNLSKSISFCNQMPNKQSVNYCIFGIHWTFKDNGYTTQSIEACKVFQNDLYTKCIEENLAKYYETL